MTDAIDSVATNPYAWAVDDRTAVLAAIEITAAQHDGLVHIAWVRSHLDRQVDPHTLGAVICALVRQRVLAGTGRYLPNGNHGSRNRTKPSEVRRLMGPLPDMG